MITIQSVSFQYKTNTANALVDINLEIQAGEHWVFLGRNGSGKSTLVKLIAGLLPIQEGSIEVAGKPVLGPTKQLIPGNKNIAFVDQDMVIEPYLTVIQNLKSGLIGASYTNSEAEVLVNELLHIAQLEGFENQKVATLSLGQKQRLSLAKAFTFDKPILIFDEPFNNVDSITRNRFIQKLKGLTNKTIISVVHSTNDAFQLGAHVALLQQGKLLEFGTIEGLYKHPKTKYAAQYLGQLLEVKLTNAIQYFRPQDFSFEPIVSGATEFNIQNTDIQYLGDFIKVHIQTDKGEFTWQDSARLANEILELKTLYLPQNKLLTLC